MARPGRNDFADAVPLPPTPCRRGPLELYEKIVLVLGILLLALTIWIHTDASRMYSVITWDNPTILIGILYGLTAFMLLILFSFDRTAVRRYRMYNDEILDQWKQDRIRFMRLQSDRIAGVPHNDHRIAESDEPME